MTSPFRTCTADDRHFYITKSLLRLVYLNSEREHISKYKTEAFVCIDFTAEERTEVEVETKEF